MSGFLLGLSWFSRDRCSSRNFKFTDSRFNCFNCMFFLVFFTQRIEIFSRAIVFHVLSFDPKPFWVLSKMLSRPKVQNFQKKKKKERKMLKGKQLQCIHAKLFIRVSAQLDAPSDWRPGGRGFNPRRGRQHSFVEIDHEIFSTVILSLLLIQEG